jgi:quercetin dioxygenase-like cupin family protein
MPAMTQHDAPTPTRGPASANRSPYVAQATDQQQLEWLGGGIMTVLFDAQSTSGQLMVLRTRLRRGDAVPVHVHSREDEMFVLLQGSGVFWVGEDRFEVGEGGVVFLPRNLPHAYRFTSETADVLTLCTPAGFEEFFRAAGHDVRLPKPAGWALTPATAAAAMSAQGARIIGPPKTEAD